MVGVAGGHCLSFEAISLDLRQWPASLASLPPPSRLTLSVRPTPHAAHSGELTMPALRKPPRATETLGPEIPKTSPGLSRFRRQGVPARWGDPARGIPRQNAHSSRKPQAGTPTGAPCPLPLPKEVQEGGSRPEGGVGSRLEGGRGPGSWGQEASLGNTAGPPNEPGPLAFSHSCGGQTAQNKSTEGVKNEFKRPFFNSFLPFSWWVFRPREKKFYPPPSLQTWSQPCATAAPASSSDTPPLPLISSKNRPPSHLLGHLLPFPPEHKTKKISETSTKFLAFWTAEALSVPKSRIAVR